MTGKFRGWDGARMWYSEKLTPDGDFRQYLLTMDGELRVFVPDWIGPDGAYIEIPTDVIRMFAMGYTVLDKDGNEKELYDGDIVRWESATRKPKCIAGFWVALPITGRVGWDKQEDRFVVHLKYGHLPLHALSHDTCILVGNKYENQN